MSAPQVRSILFVAGFAHTPNVDAAKFLVEEIVPLLERSHGPMRVTLAGSNPTDDVKALQSETVEVTGYISDERLAELYDTHRAAIVPLRFGAGVKGKVIEGLSRGLPLVTTSVGAQGIVGLDQVVPVRDDAAGLADALDVLLRDDELWLARSRAQMAFAQTYFSGRRWERRSSAPSAPERRRWAADRRDNDFKGTARRCRTNGTGLR